MYCHRCGAVVQEGANFCGVCGGKVFRVPEPAPPRETGPEKVEVEALPVDAGAAPPPQQSQFAPPPPPPRQAAYPGGPPKDYMPHNIIVAIISLLCCCNFVSLVLGIVGMVFASKAQGASARGDYTVAADAANNARLLFLIAAGWLAFSALVGLVYVIFAVIAGGASVFSNFDWLNSI